MVVDTITKIGSGGPGWRTFVETVLVIVRIEANGERKWKMHQVGFFLIVF